MYVYDGELHAEEGIYHLSVVFAVGDNTAVGCVGSEVVIVGSTEDICEFAACCARNLIYGAGLKVLVVGIDYRT